MMRKITRDCIPNAAGVQEKVCVRGGEQTSTRMRYRRREGNVERSVESLPAATCYITSVRK